MYLKFNCLQVVILMKKMPQLSLRPHPGKRQHRLDSVVWGAECTERSCLYCTCGWVVGQLGCGGLKVSEMFSILYMVCKYMLHVVQVLRRSLFLILSPFVIICYIVSLFISYYLQLSYRVKYHYSCHYYRSATDLWSKNRQITTIRVTRNPINCKLLIYSI